MWPPPISRAPPTALSWFFSPLRRSSSARVAVRGAATPQRSGEAAWHRRARRQRGAARTLLRIAAAADLVSRHHASGHSASMGGGRGKGGDGSAARGEQGARWDADISRILQSLQQQSQQQQQLLRALSGGGASRDAQRRGGKGGGTKGGDPRDRARQPSGGGADGQRRGHGRLAGAGPRPRAGDWRCAGCGAYPCFARTITCYQCGRPRHEPSSSAVRGKGVDNGRGLTASAGPAAYLGPIGAGGSRPIIGTRPTAPPRADVCPTQRVPGASVAARAEEARRINSDDDGWQPARPPHARRAPGAEAMPAPNVDVGSSAAASATATRNSWAALFEEEQEERRAEQLRDGDERDADADEDMGSCRGDEEGDEDHGDEAETGPTEAELKAVWQDHCAAYRRLEKGQPSAPPGVLAAVRAQRDDAERAWRAARTPHPLHKRLRWAENELRAAEAKEAARRAELEAHEEQAARRTRELQGMLDVDAARTARKRSALRALHQEGAQDLGPLPEIGKAARVAITGIGADIAPALTAIIEQLGDEHQGIRQDLQLLSTSLGRVEGVLRDAADSELARVQQRRRHAHHHHPAVFDISDDSTTRGGDARDEDEGGSAGGGGTTFKEDTTTAPGVATSAAPPRWTKPAPNAPWRKSAATSAGAVEEARLLLRAAAAAPQSCAPPTSPSQTNDLQVAERLEREQAVRQQQEALQRQQLVQQDPQVAAQEEQRRIQREQCQAEELHRHQEAMQKAATAAAVEDARRKEERWASLSPEEREMARRLHEQQAAVGAQVFGSQAAGQLAEMVHQTHVQELAQGRTSNGAGWDEETVQQLMGMSQEDFAQWDYERQSLM